MVLSNGQFRVMFTARDFDASRAFYGEGLGLALDHDWDFGPADRGAVYLAGGGMVEFFALAPDAAYVQPQGMGLLMQVDDTDAWHQRALERGLTVVQPPTNYPWGHRIVRLSDPDGIVVSLFSPITAQA